ncbi:Protocadherin-23 [Frankliniella fusca]|uniref:Protocadherin-23 n=1 Tax=Frankliniella fusca TaxID=407009 RepID=A0AAE1HYI0_9NEOP|nr:Protocadherin-23 [Frankliniella fusca]
MYGKNVNLKKMSLQEDLCGGQMPLQNNWHAMQSGMSLQGKLHHTAPTSVLEEDVDDPDPVLDENGFPST